MMQVEQKHSSEMACWRQDERSDVTNNPRSGKLRTTITDKNVEQVNDDSKITVNNYVRSYKFVIVVTRNETKWTIKAKITVM